MQTNTKPRALSQNPSNQPRQPSQPKERKITGIKKVPSYLSDGTSPLRIT